MKEKQAILLFDGVCNLCNSYVQFLIKKDNRAIFSFASLQSEAAKELLEEFAMNPLRLDTVVMIKENQVFTHSDVAIEAGKMLGKGWQFLSILKVIPRPIRDYAYSWIAQNRYNWFGKKEFCMIPTPELEARFLDAPKKDNTAA